MYSAFPIRFFLLTLLLLAACAQEDNRPTALPAAATATAVGATRPTPTTAQTTVAGPTATAPALPTATTSPAATTTTAPGTAVSLSDSLYALQPPLLVDGERGLIFARGQVDGAPATVVVAARDGELRYAFPTVGLPALDRQRSLLLLDTASGASPLLDANNGDRVATFAAPAGEPAAPPQLDPALDYAYLFRDETIYRYSLRDQSQQGSTQTAVPYSVCGDEQGNAPIVASDYDLISRTLYLSFVSYVCTPWVSVTIVAYDGATLQEQARMPTDGRYQMVPFAGTVHGTSASRLGPVVSWAWDARGTRQEQVEDPGLLGGIVADWGRGMVYEVVGNTILLRNAATRALVDRVALPFLGADSPQGALTLAGHDPHSDNLYFLGDGGRLYLWPAENLLVPRVDAPLTPAPSPVPAAPLRQLALTADAAGAPLLAGLWEDPACPGDVTRLYLLTGGVIPWFHLVPDAAQPCTTITATAFSPSFAADGTLFAAAGTGIIYRSADGGQHWQPSAPLPPGTTIRALYLPAGFAADHTLFAHSADGVVYRSSDAGQQWQPLDGSWDTFALLPAGGTTGALASRDATLWRTGDGGATWEEVGSTPGAESLSLLAVAPASPPGTTAFAFTASGHFYRTGDGGLTWEQRFAVVHEPPLQIAVTADANEAPFVLLLHGSDVQVVSGEGGNSAALAATWPAAPTALAFSPAFAADGLVYVGTATGLIVPVQAGPSP